jgi:FAD/FMN-containing dehydrogenase
VQLAGLEHLDERYLKAVGYTTKSKRGALPKMVLIGDIVGDDEAAVRAARPTSCASRTPGTAKASRRSGAEARKAFWRDRARTAAIARHTNAFKINEDVVIPLERLGEYTDAIERINIEFSLANKLQLLDASKRTCAASRGSARPATPTWTACRARKVWAIGSARPSRHERCRARWSWLDAQHGPAGGRRARRPAPDSG